MPKAHPPEFRRRAVEVARAGGKPQSQLARDLGISAACLRGWVAQADKGEGRREGASMAERRELAELRRKNRRLELENEILRKAAACFARLNVLPK
jgi:transposase